MKRYIYHISTLCLMGYSTYTAHGASAQPIEANPPENIGATETSACRPDTSSLSVNAMAVKAGKKNSGRNPKKGVVLALAAFPLTGLTGVHRYYLGTEQVTSIGYFVTLGGFGLVYLADNIALISATLNDNMNRYKDNPKFLMWLKKNKTSLRKPN